jgi:hypothetical protein
MRVSKEPVCIYLFRKNPILTTLHLISPKAVQHEREISNAGRQKLDFGKDANRFFWGAHWLEIWMFHL